ncbi:sacsin N-terminal ATP-binding-like domain-containing protein [Streptomyces buecherae]|uniref:sacsin N-terminal ATP-binding-like domain-containing protein n=2 Tax=Streptomyces buecherae TaxID=2763006 RepID=UPI001C26A851|nr:molecular chaperone Hsp90 [Streptomyces buecherae]
MVRGATGDADPFGTGRLRRGVLDAWAASPARFREDANAEEDLALGGYRDRLIIELAQNAADAAARAQVPGRLRLTLHESDQPDQAAGAHAGGHGTGLAVLAAANNGVPLDAAGAESLSTLRASAKRDEAPAGDAGAGGPEAGLAVGRFGVGFAAVLAVSDEPAIVSRTGGVRWSLAEARELARQAADASPGLADELRRREGHVPLLRLPLPAEGRAPEGYDTVVVLPLRDGAAEDLARRLLDAVDASLLLTLPGLAEVVVETPEGVRTLRRRQDGPYVVIEDSAHESGATRWRVARDGGPLTPDLLADRPVEERLRPVWSVTWAVPVDAEGAPVRIGGGPALPDLGVGPVNGGAQGAGRAARGGAAPVVHAPTPTDEPLGLPALLIASFPLEPTRRRVAPGPLTDFLLARAADAYATLLGDWHPVTVGTLDLVPEPLGKGELDGTLRRLVLDRLPRVAFLPSAATAYGPTEGAEADAGAGAASAPDPADPYAEPAAHDVPGVLRPVEAEVLEGAGAETVRVLADLFPHLLPAGLERRAELRALDVGRVRLGEMIERLAGAERQPAWWRRLYDALAGTDPELLSGLPVPLAGAPLGGGAGWRGEASGAVRTTIGPRQVLLPLPDGAGQGPAPDADTDTGTDTGEVAARQHRTLARLGLKVAHPDAVHPLLEKLGATPATPRAVLTTPQVRAAVAGSLDAADDDFDPFLDEDAPGGPLDGEALADTVLALVRDARLAPGDEPWLAALALPDEDGEPALAGDLVVPGSDFERVIRPGELATCDPELVERWGEETLAAVGVLAGFTLVRATDVVLDPDELEPRDGDFPEPDDVGVLDAVDVWCEDLLDGLEPTPVPPVATEIVAVRDLDLVDDDAWPLALAMLSQPPLRDALTTPVRVLLPGGTTETVRPYTAWWLRGHPVLDGRRPAGLRAAGGDPLLAGLYEAADTADVDAQVLRALGVRTTVRALLDEPGGAAELLARLADEDSEVAPAQLRGLYGALAQLAPEEVTLPDELRAVTYGQGEYAAGHAADYAAEYAVEVVDAADALVADAPDLMPLAMAEARPLLPVPPARAADLAELLQVRRLSEAYPAPVLSHGEPHEVADAVRELLPGAPLSYVEHEELLVELRAADGSGTRQVELDWRYVDGTLHAATVEGVAAGLCWAAGQWERRFEVAALLEDPTRTEELARSRWFDGAPGAA